MRDAKITAAAIMTCILLASASSANAIDGQLITKIGNLNLLSIIVLTACLISARVVGPTKRKLIVAVGLLTCFISQARSTSDSYRNSGLYQPRKVMTLSDLQIIDKLYNGRKFSGKKVLAFLVADYMPQAKVFLYAENLFPKELLGWSGRDPDSTFVIGGYQSTLDASLKTAYLERPHIIYEGMYIATPLSIYQKEKQVFLMQDGSIDYLVPGSWFHHE